MKTSKEFTGKTIEEAVQEGLRQLGLSRDNVSVEVLARPKAGFFGIGAQPAKVKLTYEAPEPAADSPRQVEATTPAPAADIHTADTPPAETPKRAAPVQRASLPEKKATEQKAPPKARPEKKQPETKVVPQDIKVSEVPGENVDKAVVEEIQTFLTGLLQRMGSDAVPVVTQTKADTFSVELTGEKLGMLIGRRGETIDAIQHLTNYSINRSRSHRVRINIDAENYRQKREESLERLANKVAGKVVRNRRNITLEPMNAYERHVIHTALQEYPDVTTYSTGQEPSRRVVVAYAKYRSVPAAQENSAPDSDD